MRVLFFGAYKGNSATTAEAAKFARVQQDSVLRTGNGAQDKHTMIVSK
jgi:hypothetical protein